MPLSLKSIQKRGKPVTMQYCILWQGVYVWTASIPAVFALNISHAEGYKVSTSN
jgi:hypothetical protein